MSYIGNMGVWELAGYRLVGYRYDSKTNSTKPKIRWAFAMHEPKLMSKEEAYNLAHAWTNAAFKNGGYTIHWQESDSWHRVQRKYLGYLYETGRMGLWRFIKDRIHLELYIACNRR